MTLAFGAIAIGLTLLLTGFIADIAGATAARAHAQLAADASALAAVAESGPYGEGRHEEVARRFAAANGAELIDCLCAPAATAVQVRVVVDGVVADARAVFDPTAMTPLETDPGATGLHPLLARSLDELLAAAGGRIHIVSGWRSSSEQSVLWADALARYGDAEAADDWVARPGSSMHEKGLAIDLGGDLELARALVERLDLPLHRPLPNEPWHFELRL